MRWFHGVYLLVLLVVASSAQAATISSAQSGDWSSASTWAGGAVPDAGDWAVVLPSHVVTTSGTVAADSVRVLGSIVTQGDTKLKMEKFHIGVGGALTYASGDSLIQAGTAPLHAGNPRIGAGRVFIYNEGTINGFGDLAAVDQFVQTGGTEVLLWSAPGSTTNVQGDNLGTATVTAIGNSAAPKQRVTVSRDFSDATHVQVTNGWFPSAVYEIESRPASNQLLLTKGKLAAKVAGTSGADSVQVPVGADSLESVVGAIVLFGAGDGDWSSGGRVVDHAFLRGANFSCFFSEENELAAAQTDADSVYFSEAIFPGAQLRFFRAATIAGTITSPATVEAVGDTLIWGQYPEGLRESHWGQRLVLDGDYDFDNFVVQHLSQQNSGDTWTVTTSGDTHEIDYGLITDSCGGNMLTVTEGGTDDGKAWVMSWVYIVDNHEPYWSATGPESNGHGFDFDDADEEDTHTVRFCGFRRLSDDPMYWYLSKGGGAFDSWMAHVIGNAAFFDTQSNAPSVTVQQDVTIERCRVYGAGPQAFQCNGAGAGSAVAIRSLVLKDSKFTRPNIRWNRDSHNADNTSESISGAFVTDQTAFTALRDTFQYNLGPAMTLSTDTSVGAADSVFVKQCVFRYNGIGYVGDQSTTPTSTRTGVGLGPAGSAKVVVSGCLFESSPRWGDGSQFSTNSARGLWVNMASATDVTEVRKSTFRAGNYLNPNISAGEGNADFLANHPQGTLMLSHSVFDNSGPAQGYGAFFASGTSSHMSVWRCFFRGFKYRNLQTRGNVNVRGNTFFIDIGANLGVINIDTQTLTSATKTIVGNLFLQPDGAGLRCIFYLAEEDTANSVIDWNMYAVESTPINRVGSTNVLAIPDGAGTPWQTNSYDQNGDDTGGTGSEWTTRNLVWRPANPRLISTPDTTSAAIDFITDTSVVIGGETEDADGSVLDAGAYPLLSSATFGEFVGGRFGFF